MNKGRVIWITGLSGAGKTTIAGALCSRLEKKTQRLVFLDGDTMREIFGAGRGYSMEERKELAQSYARLCRELSSQGLVVVCATISMFDSVREWNRKNISNYFEVYLKVDLDVLEKRHPNGLYDRARRGEVRDVIGVDMDFEEPRNPDIVVENNGDHSADEIADMLMEKIKETV